MLATSREIPERSWLAYLTSLAGLYRGWRVTIEVLSEDLGDQRVANGLPLQGLSFEIAGSEAGDILIEAGDLPDFLIHHVDHPRIMRVASTRPGFETDIEFESDDGTITLVVLQCPLLLPPGASRWGAAESGAAVDRVT